MIPKKILISGGWGYANLGDDSILLATLKIVMDKYKGAEIVVMTYSPTETEKIIEVDNVRLISSIHRQLVGEKMFQKYGITTEKHRKYIGLKRETLSERIRRKIIREYHNIHERRSYKKYLKLKKNIRNNQIYKEFDSSDLFILGGGGYFNGTWRSNLFAHVLEFEIAKMTEIKTLFIGHSVGPFPDRLTLNRAKLGFSISNYIGVRDNESYNDLRTYGFEPFLIPDTALSETIITPFKKEEVIIVIGGGGLSDTQSDIFSQAIFNIKRELDVSVKVLVSRLWASDIEKAYGVYYRLVNSIQDINIVIPTNYHEVQEELRSGKVIVSQNLHGLILGWRAGGECVSLSYSRKFVSFMSQSHQKHRIVDKSNFNSETIANLIVEAYNDFGNSYDLRLEISKQVRRGFNDALDSVCQG